MELNKSNWRRVKLGDVSTKIEENDRANAHKRFDRFLQVQHMDPGTLHIKRWASQVQGDEINPYFYKIFRKGQILFPTRNPHLRRTALASFDGICGEKTLTLEPNSNFILPEFFPFLFHSDSFYEHTTSSIIGSTNPHCRWRDVAKYEFLLPPKEQQAEIAELLWAMDEVIQKESAVLESLTRSLLVLIEEFVPRNFDKCWKLGEVIAARKGVTYKSKDYSDKENGIPLLNLKSVERGGGFNKEGIKYYKGSYKESHLAKNTDLIIACTDITRAGNVVGYPLHPSVYQNQEMLFTMDLMAIEIRSKELLRDYLYYALKSQWIHWKLFANSPGTTVLHLNLKGMLKVKIPKLSTENQEIKIKKLKDIDRNKLFLEQKIDLSRSLQKSLINQLL